MKETDLPIELIAKSRKEKLKGLFKARSVARNAIDASFSDYDGETSIKREVRCSK